MNKNTRPAVGLAAKIGAALFVLWGILHIWVGFEGAHQYLLGNVQNQWNMVIGGVNAPRAAFQHTTDAMTAHAQSQLILNFCIDVAGYGVLGMIVAAMIWRTGSWRAYFIGLLVIGIADLAFLFSLVTSGIIEANIPTISGPIIWFLAIAITPFGMPSLRQK
ncbi:hypothetical protein [Hydromonas duriensis]|uniref:Uncharacterized protein n=1 Tax=Hydromonas duriensis TaxID=1527608 RepID=A0A4R6YAK1_9BURK|nr:hypothetical protein [Hydromonas duriensis]TDR32599.1 hypothetical protein DFR44_103112 [Hydromonas duriensis]